MFIFSLRQTYLLTSDHFISLLSLSLSQSVVVNNQNYLKQSNFTYIATINTLANSLHYLFHNFFGWVKLMDFS